MSRRRFGSIRKTSSGRWQARYKGPDGRPRTGPSTFATKAEADRFLAEVDRQISRGSYIDPTAQAVTLATYATEWLRDRSLAPRTRELYDDLLRLHVLPDLGGYPLGRITPATVRAWHGDLSERTGATRTSHAYKLLRTVLNTATTDQLIERNPCTIRGAGHVEAPERPLVTLEDLFAIADMIDPWLRPVVQLAYFAHLRIGELLGLRRADLDLAAGTLTIQRQVVRVGGQLTESQTKTGRVRTVNLPPVALDVMREHLATAPAALPAAPLFTLPSGQRVEHHHIRVPWGRAVEKIGRPELHFHDLRHGGLTLVAHTGASAREIMHAGGHRTMRASLIYQHVAQSRGAEIAAAVSALAEQALRAREAR